MRWPGLATILLMPVLGPSSGALTSDGVLVEANSAEEAPQPTSARHSRLDRYAHLFLAPSPPQAGRLHARLMGVSTILFDDGRTAILIDGCFSRPDLWQVLGEIGPEPARIDAALARAGISRLAAVLTAHSHYDHALDSAEVARRTGAILVGSESTANIGLGANLPTERMRVVRGGEPLEFGRFRITVIAAPHSRPLLHPGRIRSRVRPPAPVTAYREGGSFSFLIEHGGERMLVHPSANARPDLMRSIKADSVFLGIGGIGRRGGAFLDGYWRELVEATEARLVIPIHWDRFTRPLDRPLAPGFGFDRTIAALEERAGDRVAIRLMPTFEPVDIAAAAALARRRELRASR